MLIGPFIHILLNCFKYGSESKGFYGILMMMNYHLTFMCQGIIYGTWQTKVNNRMRELSETIFWPFFIVFGVMIYGVNFPGTWKDVGYIFFYPIYDDTVIQSQFTCGSWQVIYFITWLTSTLCNQMFDKRTYKFFTGSSMQVYLNHDLWIQVSVALFVYPNIPENGGSLTFGPSWIIVYVCTESFALINAKIFDFFFQLLTPKSLKSKSSFDQQFSQQAYERLDVIKTHEQNIAGPSINFSFMDQSSMMTQDP